MSIEASITRRSVAGLGYILIDPAGKNAPIPAPSLSSIVRVRVSMLIVALLLAVVITITMVSSVSTSASSIRATSSVALAIPQPVIMIVVSVNVKSVPKVAVEFVTSNSTETIVVSGFPSICCISTATVAVPSLLVSAITANPTVGSGRSTTSVLKFGNN